MLSSCGDTHDRFMSLSPEDVRVVVQREVSRFAEVSLGRKSLSPRDETLLIDGVTRRVAEYGSLQTFLDDPDIEEIWINAPDRVFVASGGVARRVEVRFTEPEIRQIIERMLWQAGRRIDTSHPFADASLPDGSRLHVVIPDATSKHWCVNIRKFSHKVRTLSDLVAAESITRQAAEFLRMSVLAGLNIIVSGSTQAGKTTLLNALLTEARSSERIVTVEETRELDIDAEDIVGLQCRAANLEGNGEISLRRLISEALRMRPTRLVVGEVRGAECLDLLIALNSGLAGACSLHANSAREALTKLTTLPLLAGGNVDPRFVEAAVADCVDVIVHCAIDRHGVRGVSEILCVSARDAVPVPVEIFTRVAGLLEATGEVPADFVKFERSGFNPGDVLRSEA